MQQLASKFAENVENKKLRISRSNISDLKFVELLEVEELVLYGCPNVTFETTPNNIVNLDIMDSGLSNISGIKQMKQLKVLSLCANNIQDAHELQYLNNLQKLSLMQNYVNNVHPLRKLVQLTALYIGGCLLTDISPLRYLTNIQKMSLAENAIIDISALKYLKKLQVLHIQGNKIISIRALEHITCLEYVNIIANKIAYVSPLAQHTNKKDFSIEGYQETPTKEEIIFSQKLQIIYENNEKRQLLIKMYGQQKQTQNKFIQTSNQQINEQHYKLVSFSSKISDLFQQLGGQQQ
ncbi:leucine-rich_repeat domain-containing protein [Hexamita inflata]|uniref:Leucine-rich repeat domain-containing protein n=1 Tax=Hexamita inflata TaxID=28002 RepID=A0AA86R4N2_9EUKA|nr:leucine-rich repeat domain-containing protein [Hexamita inflata]